MDEKKNLKIDMQDLTMAMEQNSYEEEYFLDLETGEILFTSDALDGEDNDAVREKIDDDPDRFEEVPKADSREGYGDMQDFIETVQDEHIAEVLSTAIEGRGAFRRFKDTLLRYPDQRELWFKFKDDLMQKRALEWLDEIGIQASEDSRSG